MNYLLLTVRFLDDRYHGLLDRGGPPEWPPSPYRLFQAIVAGVAQRGELVVGPDTPENTNYTDIGKAVRSLQELAAPIIIAPLSKTGQATTRFVPNNDGDEKPERQERLTAKASIPTLFLLAPEQKPEVHYVWDISQQSDLPVDHIRDAARSLTALGWGIDMAFADARTVSQAEVESLIGVRWRPESGVWQEYGMLRTPTTDAATNQCSLCDLRHCHDTAKHRIPHGKPLRTVDKPKVFGRVFYTSTERQIRRPFKVFHLINPDEGQPGEKKFSYPHQKFIHIAAMVRHLAIEAMSRDKPRGTPDNWVDTYVAGHAKPGVAEHPRFSYIPLPSIGHAHTDPSIRRVMITAPPGDERWLEFLTARLVGCQLQPLEGTKLPKPPILDLPRNQAVVGQYTEPANTWASVTPVILPGYNDHSPAKTQKLIEKALAQAGLEVPCEYEWRAVSWFPKSLTAHKYDRQKNEIGYIRPGHLLNFSAVHLRITFKDGLQFPGPLAIGAGRHCGFGLFAAHD